MNTFDPDKFEQQSHPYTIKRLSPSIGAELLDLDLKNSLSEDLKDEIYQALLVYKVIFFRDQDLSIEEHLEFANNFGELEIHPFANNDKQYPEVLKITHNEKNKGRENLWHSDVTWRLEPSLGSILRMKEAPKVGGDTLFADMYAAYEDLSDEMKEQLDGAVAVHDFEGFRKRLEKKGVSKEEIEDFNKKFPMPEHPVIRTHPDTGKKLIYVNAAFTKCIKDWEVEESSNMLKYLYSRASTPEYQCRFVWKDNSIAFWDNRSVQHYAASDYWPQVRKVERVTIIGDRPR
ncbi:MAG: TauD/TfdA family dioxygenase [SAR86 cluster bacterium]|jgi:taurine dioxygenase|nr:TauD/TfdA family dioxygenase [SAR86 cluster bacterium]|tara:strand:- start:1543 stop:2409 length:867 start_codon:yes stop_codon:yes gene_type:complete